MKHQTQLKLRAKGVSASELARTKKILDHPRSHDPHFAKVVFYSALIVIVFANIIISAVLIPFLVLISGPILYTITTILALMVGFLYNFLITDIGHLEKHHHIFASIITPLIALANLALITFAANKYAITANNPIIIATLFAIAFILPSIIGKLHNMHHANKAKIV